MEPMKEQITEDFAEVCRRYQLPDEKINQIEKAIRDLKKKLTKEGFFSEIKDRRFYDKPSVQKKKKMAKAAKRRRKRMRRMP